LARATGASTKGPEGHQNHGKEVTTKRKLGWAQNVSSDRTSMGIGKGKKGMAFLLAQAPRPDYEIGI